MTHIPVLLEEVQHAIHAQPGQTIIDGTLGFGGHARAIISQIGSTGRYLGIDQDQHAITFCRNHLAQPPAIIVHGNFESVRHLAQSQGINQADAILADLGISSFQLDHPERGFSFQTDAPLDMRMNMTTPKTAAQILAKSDAETLHYIFQNHCDLRKTDRLIQNIIDTRKKNAILRTSDLVSLIKKSFYFHNSRSAYINTCAQVFQALRMAVNRELAVIERFITDAIPLLKPEGRLAIITFHSIEDRTVKQTLAKFESEMIPVNKKVIRAKQTEIRKNSRSRSAKLRVVQKR